MSKVIAAIDPGANGGIAWTDSERVWCAPLPDTPHGLVELLGRIEDMQRCPGAVTVYLEKIIGNAGGCRTAQQGLSFGRNYGRIEMALSMMNMSIIDITPQGWQKELKTGSKKGMSTTQWKAHLKGIAERIFPPRAHEIKITNATADALLILRYGIIQERLNHAK